MVASAGETHSGLWPRLARLLTDVVSPPIVFAALGFAIALGSPQAPQWGSALIYALFICLIPLGVVVALYRMGRISDLHMSNNIHERHIPYLVGFACALAAWTTFRILDAPLIFRGLAFCNAIGLATLGLINRYWLISNHSASISMAAAFVGYVFGPEAGLALLPLVALVSAVRLYLKRHTIRQVAAGIALGVVPVLVVGQFGYLS